MPQPVQSRIPLKPVGALVNITSLSAVSSTEVPRTASYARISVRSQNVAYTLSGTVMPSATAGFTLASGSSHDVPVYPGRNLNIIERTAGAAVSIQFLGGYQGFELIPMSDHTQVAVDELDTTPDPDTGGPITISVPANATRVRVLCTGVAALYCYDDSTLSSTVGFAFTINTVQDIPVAGGGAIKVAVPGSTSASLNYQFYQGIGEDRLTALGAHVSHLFSSTAIHPLALPLTAARLVGKPSTAAVLYTLDGTDPTSTLGFEVPTTGTLDIAVQAGGTVKLIRRNANARLNYQLFGRR